MSGDLKKFVNSKFLRTVSLPLLKQLFARQPADHQGLDLAIFDKPDDEARQALTSFFMGPEDLLPRGLVADLHHIAELGTLHGMNLLQNRAALRGTEITPPLDTAGKPLPLDPKQFAILAFLRHRDIFDVVSDLMAREARSSLNEYVGLEEGVEPDLSREQCDKFELSAKEMFSRNYHGTHCRVGWYDDGPRTILVVNHGAPVTVQSVVEGEREDVISYRSLEQAVLEYNPGTGRLGIGGVPKARRADLAEFFAKHILHRPGFFAAEDSQDLYTLEPVEKTGFSFKVRHDFDPLIKNIEIVEVQIDRFDGTMPFDKAPIEASVVVKDFRGNALARVLEFSDRIGLGEGRHRIGHLTMRVVFRGERRDTAVTVKIKPPAYAIFKRQHFEQNILDLLRHNGFWRERQPGEVAAAAD